MEIFCHRNGSITAQSIKKGMFAYMHMHIGLSELTNNTNIQQHCWNSYNFIDKFSYIFIL